MNTKAFPVVTDEVVLENGMDLRDYFAAAALQSLAHAVRDELVVTLEDQAADIARACYTIADAMMAARAAR